MTLTINQIKAIRSAATLEVAVAITDAMLWYNTTCRTKSQEVVDKARENLKKTLLLARSEVVPEYNTREMGMEELDMPIEQLE